MGFWKVDANSPEGVRRDVRITVVFSVLLLGLGVWEVSAGKTVTGLGAIFGASVFLWLARRNYRIARDRGWFPARR
jgi:hypothetical protein